MIYSFSSGLHISAKKNLYLSLVRSQLTYGSQIWRPHLLKDITALERIQRRATKYILNDFHSDYKHCLLSLRLLPLMMQLELFDILFFIRCLKDPDNFSIFSYVRFSEGSTRSSTHFKLKHSISKSNTTGHFYFNRLWNSLPPINLDLSISTIKNNLLQVFWNHFSSRSIPCSLHYLCPCAKCLCSSVVTRYSVI